MTDDLTTFALVLSIVWGALALYLVWLHRVARALEARLERLERDAQGIGT